MRYEVEKQVEEIDKALGIITLYQIPNMEVTREELEIALRKAESCMKLVMNTLCRKDVTMKEWNDGLKKN